MEVFRELASRDDHPDARTVYERVRRRIPAISLDTVYRTLMSLEGKGLVEKVDFGGESVRFDANTNTHHHLVCTKCGSIEDYYLAEANRLPPPAELASWGDVQSVHVQMRGVCSRCKVNGPPEDPR
jgi:Fur family peroxide stress response transcriptional regulator